MSPEPKFTPDSFDDPDEPLEAAARLTLRLACCHSVEGCKDTDSWDGLYERIMDLMVAYVHSIEGKGEMPDVLMTRFAASVALVIASAPSLRAAVAAHLATTQDNDP
jgi:hypothetical protein